MDVLVKLLPLLVFSFVVVSIVRGALKVARNLGAPSPATRRSPADFDPAEAERTRRIQEEIRRKIAERRNAATVSEAPLRDEPASEPPIVAAEPPSEPLAPDSTAAVMERQQRLADQLRALESARLMEQRKAAAVAAVVQSETEQSVATEIMRGALLSDLQNAATARRAILLREVLDRPVALR